MKKIEIRQNGSKRVYTVNTEPSKTDPSYKSECDVNNILSKYVKTGEITHLARKTGSYADVSNVPDLLTAHTLPKQIFETLPVDVQRKFQTPAKLIEFLQDPKNLKEAEKLGLLTIKDESGLIPSESAAKQAKRARGEDEDPEEQEADQDGLTRSPRGHQAKKTKTQDAHA